jgi:HlyD family secretion protein
VVTYITVVNVDNTDLKLKPGMTANVSIEVARKDDVLKLPPAALRFKPKSKTEESKQGRPAGSTMGSGKPAGRKGAGGQQVYTLRDNKPVAVPVKTGIANNSAIELIESTLKDGDEVIIEQIGGDTKKKASSSGSPMGRPF